jgi:hypothetical protein
MEITLTRFVSFLNGFTDLATSGFVKNTDSIFLLFVWVQERRSSNHETPLNPPIRLRSGQSL